MSKKNCLILEWGQGEIHTSAWFQARKIGRPLIHKYLTTGLLQRLGGGAYIKAGDHLDWQAAIYAAQTELKLPMHVGGRSALELLGVSHYLNMGDRSAIFLIATRRFRMPIWIRANDWGVDFRVRTSTIFKDDIGIETLKRSNFAINISSRERAIMEVIDTVDLRHSFEEIEQYTENLLSIRSNLTQNLLEQCTSIRTKRVFLYIASKMNLPVIKKLHINKINLGRGDRTIALNGKFDKKFAITVPTE